MKCKPSGIYRLFILVLISFLFACNDKKTSSATEDKGVVTSFDLAAAKKTIEDGNKKWSEFFAKGDSAGVASLYTADAKIMPPGGTAVVGKGNIELFIASLTRMGLKDFRPVTGEIWGSENLIGEEGTWSLHNDKGEILDNGKYIVLWKTEDGVWKLFRDCWNSDVPPKPAG
ncbi:MAG: DUF4440 domain-containing protein [Ginsengibacter sp.]